MNHPPTPPSPIRFPLSFIYRRWQQAVCWPSAGQYGLDDVDMVPVRKYIYIYLYPLSFSSFTSENKELVAGSLFPPPPFYMIIQQVPYRPDIYMASTTAYYSTFFSRLRPVNLKIHIYISIEISIKKLGLLYGSLALDII